MIKSNIEKIQIKLNNTALKNQILVRDKSIKDAKALIWQYKEVLNQTANEKKELEIKCKMLENQLNIIPNFIRKFYNKRIKRLSN